jgi:HK97 family phage major capsid protein
MTILELKDDKAQVLAANDKIFELADAEKRSLTDKEHSTIENNNRVASEYDLRIDSESRKSEGGSKINKRTVEQPKEGFSLIKSINAILQNKPVPESTRDLNALANIEFRNAGVSALGSIQIPAEVRADILAGTPTAGQEIVPEEKKAILPPLVDKLVLVQAGATFLTGLKGTVSIPSYAGTTAAWVTEVANVTETGGAFSEVIFTPKRLSAVIDVSKLFLAQDGVGAEKMLLDNISNAIARKLESSILGKAPIEVDYPQGMGARITTVGATKAVVTPTYADILALETNVDTANALAGNLAYITNSAGRGILKSTIQGPSGVGRYLLEDNEMNGYPVLVTNSCSNTVGAGSSGNLLVFGNWADLCITQWGGFDITIDPYTVAPEGQVRIVINAYFDAKGLRGKVGGVSGYDYYTKSFDELGII